MCRRNHYWFKCRQQQAVVRLRWRQRAQEVFQRLFTVNLCFPSLSWFLSLLPRSLSPDGPSRAFWVGTSPVFLSHSVYLVSVLCMVSVSQFLSNDWHLCRIVMPSLECKVSVTDICCLKYFSVSHAGIWLLSNHFTTPSLSFFLWCSKDLFSFSTFSRILCSSAPFPQLMLQHGNAKDKSKICFEGQHTQNDERNTLLLFKNILKRGVSRYEYYTRNNLHFLLVVDEMEEVLLAANAVKMTELTSSHVQMRSFPALLFPPSWLLPLLSVFTPVLLAEETSDNK